MIKKFAVRAGVLTAVFIAAVILFSYLTNRGNTDMSADMGGATLPRVSFQTEGYEVNSLPGYVTDMQLPSTRDTITPVSSFKLTLETDAYDAQVEGLTWEVYTLDGKELLQSGEVEGEADEVTLHLRAADVLTTERALKVTLHLDGRDVYYYTRIVDAQETSYKECLDFVRSLHTAALHKNNEEIIRSVFEPDQNGDNTTYGHVTIHSDQTHVTWGELKPDVVGDVRWEVKECNPAYTSVRLAYQVNLTGDAQNPEGLYEVREFFRVHMVGDRQYLLDYDRTMEQWFEGGKGAVSEKGLELGVAASELDCQHDSEGNVVAFVRNRELWNYDKKADELSLIFSFADAESVDIRNLYDRHELHIVSVAKNGDTVFTVAGYMNRGVHEGQTGVAVYLFHAEKNSVEEKAFVPSKKGYFAMKEELGRSVYYSIKSEKLYVMTGGALYSVDMEKDTREVLVRGLSEGQYVVSDDGHLLAYQNTVGKSDGCQKLTVLNLEQGTSFDLTSSGDAYLTPIGFIRTDFAYGIWRGADRGRTAAGIGVSPMYRVEIVNQKSEQVKDYEVSQIYILSGSVDGNMLTLSRATRSGDLYSPTQADYITNNEEEKESNIYPETYQEEQRQRVLRIRFADGISDLSAKLLKPKQVLFERPMTVNFDESELGGKYYVYACGKLQGAYSGAVQAVQRAEAVRGVAVTSRQAYLWEQGNVPKLYEVDDMEPFTSGPGETSMAACLRLILTKEGSDIGSASVVQELAQGALPAEILSRYVNGEGLDLTGCTVEEIRYTISRETPVIAVLGENHAVLLFGYNETNVAYLDPTDGQRHSVPIAELQNTVSANGSVFVGYAK